MTLQQERRKEDLFQEIKSLRRELDSLKRLLLPRLSHSHPISHPGQERFLLNNFSFSSSTWTYIGPGTLVKDTGGVTWDGTRWNLDEEGWWHCSCILNLSEGASRFISRILLNGSAGAGTSSERSRLELDPSASGPLDAFLSLSCVFWAELNDKVGVAVWSNEANPEIIANSRFSIAKVG